MSVGFIISNKNKFYILKIMYLLYIKKYINGGGIYEKFRK